MRKCGCNTVRFKTSAEKEQLVDDQHNAPEPENIFYRFIHFLFPIVEISCRVQIQNTGIIKKYY